MSKKCKKHYDPPVVSLASWRFRPVFDPKYKFLKVEYIYLIDSAPIGEPYMQALLRGREVGSMTDGSYSLCTPLTELAKEYIIERQYELW